MDRLPVLVESLRMSETVKSFYVGYPNGEFFLVRSLQDLFFANRFQAPAGAGFLVQSMTQHNDGTMVGKYRFFDEELRNLEMRAVTGYRYDLRTRP